MTSWIILLIKQYIDIAKYLLIGDAIFDLNNDKKKRTKENIILSSIILVIYIIFYSKIEDIWIDLNALICLIYLIIIYRDKLFKTFKVVIITILITTVLEQFMNLFFKYNLYEPPNMQFVISNILRLLIVICGVKPIKMAKLIYIKKYNLSEMPWYIFMNVIFCFSATLFPQFIVVMYHDIVSSRVSMSIIIVAHLNIVISFISIILFIKNKKEKEQYYLDSIMKDKTLKLQEDYYKKIIDNYSNIRKFKHDIKGHLAVVNELINSKNYDEANIYIGNMSEAITGKDIYNTNNIYISSILNSFDQSFIDNKIEFDLSYYIISDLKMNSMDICSLFYNLILNAVEANLKIEDKRFIKLYIANIKNNVLIKIVNPVDENFNLDIIKENKTTKEDKENHGFGLITINNIISKYNGNIDYSIHDQYLIADITILNVL
ncbi:MAG: sensor histidine kinase [Thomasclavelia ramosa]